MNYNKFLDDIQRIRERNNKNWISILRLAFKYAPKDAAELMRKISSCDSKINKLSNKLGGNGGDIPKEY